MHRNICMNIAMNIRWFHENPERYIWKMKKRYVFLSIIVDLLMIGLIPLNLFVLSIPEWVMIVVTVILVGVLVLFYMKGKRHLSSKPGKLAVGSGKWNDFGTIIGRIQQPLLL